MNNKSWLIPLICLSIACLIFLVYLIGRRMDLWSKIKDSINLCLRKKNEIKEDKDEKVETLNSVDDSKKICDNDQQQISSIIVEQPKSSYDEKWRMIQNNYLLKENIREEKHKKRISEINQKSQDIENSSDDVIPKPLSLGDGFRKIDEEAAIRDAEREARYKKEIQEINGKYKQSCLEIDEKYRQRDLAIEQKYQYLEESSESEVDNDLEVLSVHSNDSAVGSESEIE